MGWDERWMGLARHIAHWSKDRSRRCGAVIVDDRQVLVSQGWNGFPRGIDDTVESRHQAPSKYMWTEHAERNAFYNAAANGHPTRGCTLYVSWYPCIDCARSIIQGGIRRIVCVEPDWTDPTWGESFATTREMLSEAGVEICLHPHFPPDDGMLRAAELLEDFDLRQVSDPTTLLTQLVEMLRGYANDIPRPTSKKG
jgi:dCMP deaminase